MSQTISIVGQGYVGLPLALAAARVGFNVVGIDSNYNRVKQLNSGISIIEDITDDEIKSVLEKNKYKAQIKLNKLNGYAIYIICVPTPLDNAGKPDMSYVQSAAISIAKVLKPGDLVILESTVEPGATRNYLLPTLEKESGLAPNSFYLAFSPERVDPINKVWTLKNIPKIVSGINSESMHLAIEFYSNFVENLVECESLEIAETAKLLENSFRLVNISFINEISTICSKLGIDVQLVIEAASTKPYGFMPFYPSIGVGGHCIPVDPIYLSEKASVLGAPSRMIELANDINDQMPDYFVGRAKEKLGFLKDKRILVVGVAYKPNVSDVRETPVEALLTGLTEQGAKVYWHDDLVKEWNGSKSVALSSDYDLAIIATPHSYIDIEKLGNILILNTRGSL